MIRYGWPALLLVLLVAAGCSRDASRITKPGIASTKAVPDTARSGHRGAHKRLPMGPGGRDTLALQALSAQDSTYLQSAVQSARAEIVLGGLAQARGGSRLVTQFGRLLVADHSRQLTQDSLVCVALHQVVPSAPSPAQQAAITALSALRDTAFDAAFVPLMVQAHRTDIALTTAEETGGTNVVVRRLAARALPMLQKHLRLALRIARILGIST